MYKNENMMLFKKREKKYSTLKILLDQLNNRPQGRK